MSKPYVGANVYRRALDTILEALGESLEALDKLNTDELSATQAALLMTITNAQLTISLQISGLEKFGESVKDIDRAIKTGELKMPEKSDE
jgi:hypothetical protein